MLCQHKYILHENTFFFIIQIDPNINKPEEMYFQSILFRIWNVLSKFLYAFCKCENHCVEFFNVEVTTEVKALKSYFWYEESPRPKTANFIFIKELFGKFFLIINFQNIWKCLIDTVLHLLIFVCKIYFRNKQQL